MFNPFLAKANLPDTISFNFNHNSFSGNKTKITINKKQIKGIYLLIFKLINLKINKYIPLICLVFIVVLVLLPESELWIKLDSVVSGRLTLAKNGLNNYGVSIFGSNVQFTGSDITGIYPDTYNFVDSSYINYMIRYGILNLVCILLIYEGMIIRSIKDKDVYMLLACITILIIGIFDPYLYDLPFNIFPVLAFSGKGIYESE